MGIINDMRRKQKEDDDAYERNMREEQAKHNRLMYRYDAEILPNMKVATLSEYNEWITGFIANGGKPTHCYDYPMQQQFFFVAKNDFKLFPLHGSSSFSLIVPKGITVDACDRGHINLFYMDGFTPSDGFVPIFSDTKEIA